MAETRETELLRVEQVAVALGVHRSTVFELLREGGAFGPSDRAVRVPRRALHAWIDDRTELPLSDERWRRLIA